MATITTQPVTAWRHAKRGKAHRRNDRPGTTAWWTKCYLAQVDDDTWEQVPLSRVAPEDICKRCWKDVTR